MRPWEGREPTPRTTPQPHVAAPHRQDDTPRPRDDRPPHRTEPVHDPDDAPIVRDERPSEPEHRQYPGPIRYDGPRGPRPYPGRPAGPGRRPSYPARPVPRLEGAIALAEDEELVAGRRPVEEAFVARREAKRLLVVPQRRLALEKLVLHATSLRIPVVEVEGGTLTAVAGFDGHQGIALVVAPRRWASPDDVLALAVERGEPPLILVLDSLEDPQNVGTLLRTAEATGVHGAVFPTHRQAPLTPAAVKASAGAVEHLRLAPVDDLAGALADLHGRGLRIVGADGDALLTAREADLRGPIAIVVGSEGRGLGPAVRRRCDLLVRIPMHGHIQSLNAAVAGSILLYEAAAQRRLVEAPRTDPDERDAGVVAAATDPPAPNGPDASPDMVAEDAKREPEPESAPEPTPEAPPVPQPEAAKPARATRKPRAAKASASAPDPAGAAAPAAAEEDLLPGGPSVDAPAGTPLPIPEV